MNDNPILAAGGLVIRPDDDGTTRVLLVHRPQYDDCSLPKGKADPGEVPEHTAVREVQEETGVRAEVIAPLAEVEYRVSSGRRKVVRYFAMRHRAEAPFRPNEEVDEIRWLEPDQAADLATYEHDRALLHSDLDHLISVGTVWLVRHAAAGDRSSWTAEDHVRPLTAKGRKQAAALADALFPLHVDEIYSSPYLRCRQTVEPLAERCGLPVVDSDHLIEGARGDTTLQWIRTLAGRHVVACSHGDVIPSVIRRLEDLGVPLYSPNGVFDVKKGSVWTLALEGERVTSATYTPPPTF